MSAVNLYIVVNKLSTKILIHIAAIFITWFDYRQNGQFTKCSKP
jgi:hypothetical protein